jgi:hypothetical protein
MKKSGATSQLAGLFCFWSRTGVAQRLNGGGAA